MQTNPIFNMLDQAMARDGHLWEYRVIFARDAIAFQRIVVQRENEGWKPCIDFSPVQGREGVYGIIRRARPGRPSGIIIAHG